MSQDKITITIKTYKIVEEITEMTKEEFYNKYEDHYKNEIEANWEEKTIDKTWNYLKSKGDEIIMIQGDYGDLDIDENSFAYAGDFDSYVEDYLPDCIDYDDDEEDGSKIMVSHIKCNRCQTYLPTMSIKDHLTGNFTHKCVTKVEDKVKAEIEDEVEDITIAHCLECNDEMNIIESTRCYLLPCGWFCKACMDDKHNKCKVCFASDEDEDD